MDAIWRAIQDAWNAVLGLTARLVTPDWGALIALIPVGLGLLVLAFFAWIVIRYANAGPTRRGPARVAPRAPETVHMPGPSFAPIFAAAGTFLFFFGLIIGLGSIPFWLGSAALALTLLYWLREAMRDYDRLDRERTGLPAIAYPAPPPGVHMPGPSFRPLLVSLAFAVFLAGLAAGPGLLVAGLIMLTVALLGWLADAGREYHATAEADETGHLATGPAPHYPIGTLATFVVVLVAGIALTAGVIPPTSGEGGAAGSASPTAGGSAMPGMPGGSPGASASAVVPAADITVTAQNIAYVVAEISVPAGKPFTIAFVNNDAGVPHNIAIRKDSPAGTEVWRGEIFSGVATKVYQVPALEAGTYGFACSIHPNMTGTLTVK